MNNTTTKEGFRAGLVGIATNILLAAVKLAVGLVSGSIAIVADALNNFSDSLSSIVTAAGFKLAARPADEEHPYGHARMEYITGMVVSLIVIVLGFELGKTSVEKIISPEESVFSGLTFAVLVLSVLVKVWQSAFYKKVGTRIQSASLKAVSVDSRNDAIATSAVLLGCLITKFTSVNLDGYLGLLVAILILVSGAKLVKETSGPLLGTLPPKELTAEMKTILTENEKVLGYHDLHFHDYGAGKYWATVHLEMDSNMDALSAHSIIDGLEREAKERLGVELVIHLDPVVRNDIVTEQWKTLVLRLLSNISEDIRMHDFRVNHDSTPLELSFDIVVPYHFPLSDASLKEQTEAAIHAVDPHITLYITVDHDE